MQNFGLAPSDAPVMTGGLADSVFERAAHEPALPQLARRTPGAASVWSRVSAAELHTEVVDLARGFVASGINPGDRIAVMARPRYEWTLLCCALWAIGAEVVPVDPSSAHDDVAWVLDDAECVGVVVEDEQTVMTVGSVCAALPRLRYVWQLDDGALEHLVERGRPVPAATVDSLRRIVLPDATAVVAYTSGTGGRPRGCALSHRALAAPCDALLAGWRQITAAPGEQPAVLAFLPFSHVYGLMVQGLCLRGGLLMGHEPDAREESLAAALRSFRPTYLYAVPSVFERIHKSFRTSAERAGRGALFERAARTARDHAEAVERQRLGTGPGPGLDLKFQHTLYDKAVYRRLRESLGGRVRGGVSGGSPLGRELALFYAGIGIPVHDGYGLTETAGGVTAQPVGREKTGTVGRPLPGMDVHVAADGEILVRGPSLFQGYVGDDLHNTATRAVLQDGWLATGDVGSLDSEGYLSVTGRKSDVVVTVGGRTLTPTDLEQRLRMHPLIHQVVVVGHGRPVAGALITLDQRYLAHWRAGLGDRGDASSRTAREQNALRQEVTRAVSEANTTVPRGESIRVFRILPESFTPGNGLLTASLKLRRTEILRRYATEIDAMYQTHGPLRADWQRPEFEAEFSSTGEYPEFYAPPPYPDAYAGYFGGSEGTGDYEDNDDDVFRRVR
ncbi:Long-chain-fatty-acid--CoA ligase [Actinobacteria bacterium OK074]|nr:Long-chain-fatty-acid--CoA ligase [Actinobacteria bacterium OK074]